VFLTEEMGVSREGFYKSFSGKRKPNIETVFNALDKLGMQVIIQPKIIAGKNLKVKTVR